MGEMGGALNLVKLSVGTESVEGLARWQARYGRELARARGGDARPRHGTRMWPKRAEELLAGGSIYWVIRGAVRARQRILGLERHVREDGPAICEIVLDPTLIPTAPQPKRPFQGWRYLTAADAPPDLAGAAGDPAAGDALPPELAAALAEVGVVAAVAAAAAAAAR